jgi:hypothetical protein
MNIPVADQAYVTGLKEILWGILLVAITLSMHGVGMLTTLQANGVLKERFERKPSLAMGLSTIIVTSWMIILVHLLEVFIWAGFFLWKGALTNSNASLCYYFALLDYTTLGSPYNLTLDWRLLEGMIAIAGLLTFAWSTGVLMTVAQEFQDRQLMFLKQRREKRQVKTTANHAQIAVDPTSESSSAGQGSHAHESKP